MHMRSIRHWITHKALPGDWDPQRLQTLALRCEHNPEEILDHDSHNPEVKALMMSADTANDKGRGGRGRRNLVQEEPRGHSSLSRSTSRDRSPPMGLCGTTVAGGNLNGNLSTERPSGQWQQNQQQQRQVSSTGFVGQPKTPRSRLGETSVAGSEGGKHGSSTGSLSMLQSAGRSIVSTAEPPTDSRASSVVLTRDSESQGSQNFPGAISPSRQGFPASQIHRGRGGGGSQSARGYHSTPQHQTSHHPRQTESAASHRSQGSVSFADSQHGAQSLLDEVELNFDNRRSP